MGKYDPDFAGMLKNAWDMQLKKHDRLVLVVCGSVSTWINKNILESSSFAGRISRPDNREYFESILKMFMGEVLYLLDRLPVCEDLGILKNILCHGIWAQFRRKYPSPDGE